MLSIEELTTLCSLFEKRASVNLFVKTIKAYDVSYYYCHESLEKLLNAKVTPEDFDRWLEINASADINPTGYWDSDDSADGSYNMRDTSGGWDNLRVISTVPEVEEYNTKRSTLLKGTGSIPNLYLIHAARSSQKALDVPKDFTHDAYLVIALAGIFNSNKQDVIDEVYEFYKENKDKIEKLRRSFSYHPKLLGEGSDGAAFDVGPNLVLKIFTDQTSYLAAKEAMVRLHGAAKSARTEAMIYDVGILGEFRGFTLYYYLIEKMVPVKFNAALNQVTAEIHSIILEQGSYLSDLRDELYPYSENVSEIQPISPKSLKKIEKTVKDLTRVLKSKLKLRVKDNVKIINNQYDLSKDWLTVLFEEVLMKYFTRRGDLHLGNIGVTNQGYFRYFDPAYADWREKLNLPTAG